MELTHVHALNPSSLSLYYDIPGREKLQVNSQLEFPNYPLNTGIAGELSGVGSHGTPTDINELCIIYLLHIMNTYLLIHTKTHCTHIFKHTGSYL